MRLFSEIRIDNIPYYEVHLFNSFIIVNHLIIPLFQKTIKYFDVAIFVGKM